MESDVIEMYEAGVPIREMAEVLGSTVHAVGSRLDRLQKEGRVERRRIRKGGVR